MASDLPQQHSFDDLLKWIKEFDPGDTAVEADAEFDSDPERTATASQFSQAELESYRQDTAERKKYASNIFGLMAGWILFIVVVILLQASETAKFELTENVLLALIVTTTANILGLFVIVANYLFPKSRAASTKHLSP